MLALGLALLCAPAAAQTYALQPSEGLEFRQLDFTFPGATSLDSEYGLASIDFQAIAAASGISKGYVNVVTPQGWVVRNVPHDASLDFPGLGWMFDLGSTGQQSTLLAHAEVSTQYLTGFAAMPSTNFTVGDVEYNAQGVGAMTTAAPGGAIQHATVSFQNVPATQNYAVWQKGHHNIEQAVNQCHTAAVANSLQWLEDKTGTPVPHPHAPGAPGSNTLVGALDAASNRAAGQPTSFAATLSGKLTYLDQNGLGDKFMVKHKNALGSTRMPFGNQTVGSATSYGRDLSGVSLFDFIVAELEAGEDVELIVEWPDGSAHSVQVMGAGKHGGRPFISFHHDANQGAAGGTTNAKDAGYLGFYLENDLRTSADYFNKANQKAKISYAISESPWGLPSPSAPSTPATPSTPPVPTGPGKGSVTTKPLSGTPSNPTPPETASASTTSSNAVVVATADGRGQDWSPTTRVDQDVTGASKATQPDSIAIGNHGLYVAWTDSRIGPAFDTVYFNRSLDGGSSWLGEQEIPGVRQLPFSHVFMWKMSVDAGTSADHIHIFALVDQGSGLAQPMYVRSLDGGATWQPALEIGVGFVAGVQRASDAAMHVDGDTIHVAWADDTFSPGVSSSVFYQRSDDDGANWMAADLRLDSMPPGTVHDGELVLRAGAENAAHFVAAAWKEHRSSPANAEIRLNSSMDSGDSWLAADVQVGEFNPLVANAFDIDLAIHNWGAFVLWDDNRTGTYEAYLASTFNGGLYFDPDLQLSSGGAETPSFARGPEPLAAIFIGGGGQPRPMVCTTGDGGQSWRLPVSLGTSIGGQPSSPSVAWNSEYGTAIATWRSNASGFSQDYFGGVRPQSLELVGTLQAGSQVHFEVSGFPWAEYGWNFGIAASLGRGGVLLPGDGRLTGLAMGNVLILTSNLPLLRGVLASGGSGQTPTLNVPPNVVPGTTFWCIAASFDPSGGFGSMTNLVPIVAQ